MCSSFLLEDGLIDASVGLSPGATKPGTEARHGILKISLWVLARWRPALAAVNCAVCGGREHHIEIPQHIGKGDAQVLGGIGLKIKRELLIESTITIGIPFVSLPGGEPGCRVAERPLKRLWPWVCTDHGRPGRRRHSQPHRGGP